MRLQLVTRGVTVPDKFRYKIPEDGHWIAEHMDPESWLRAIRKHYADNGYPIPDDLQQIAEDQLCRTLPAGWCRYVDGRDPEAFIDRRIGVSTVISGTKVFAKFLLEGAPTVSQEEAERRALICSRCYALDTVQGCGSCLSIAEAVSEVVGARKTPSDAALEGKACLVCKCSAKANVWMPVEVSRVGVSEERLKLFPEFCWKKQGIEALIAKTPDADMSETHG